MTGDLGSTVEAAATAMTRFAEAFRRCWLHDTDAAYLWTGQDGDEVPLCVRCCANWRERASGDPTLAPVRITMFMLPLNDCQTREEQ